MGAVFSYSLYSSIILLSLYLCYKWAMAGENQHRFNRVALWIIYTVALIAMPVSSFMHSLAAMPQIPVAEVDIEGIMIAFDSSDMEEVPSQPIYLTLLLGTYFIGMMAVLLHTVWVGVRLWHVIASGERRVVDGCTLVLIDDETIAPFSWCRYIVMSRRDWAESGEMIAVHERQHLHLGHWFDLLLAQCVAVIQWYNPAAWLMREELKAVHEYQADSAVLETGVNARDYQMLLIKKAVGARFPSLANSLNHSKLKKRITMMYNSKTSRLRRMRGLALVPACAAALLVTNIPAVADILSDTSSATVFASEDKPVSRSVESIDVASESVPEAAKSDMVKPQAEEIVVVAYGAAGKDTEKSESVQPEAAKTAGTIVSVALRDETDASSAVSDDKKVFDIVEEKPQFPGGEAALMRFVAENIRYPQEALKAKKEGRVVVQFVVTKTGGIGDVKVIRGVDRSLDAEAIRVVKSLPAFTPGKLDGKPVNVWYTIPISFKTSGNDNSNKTESVKQASSDAKITVNGVELKPDDSTKFQINGEDVTYQALAGIDANAIESINIDKRGDIAVVSITLKKDASAPQK